ncbi:MAG TPA: hypothetical protein PLK57_00565 [Clostridiales bacterium]|nr:hypothetical protein [Clostridiales bacterium]
MPILSSLDIKASNIPVLPYIQLRVSIIPMPSALPDLSSVFET